MLAVAVLLTTRFALGVLDAEGVGDAPIVGFGLTVDAMRVDLQEVRALHGVLGLKS